MIFECSLISLFSFSIITRFCLSSFSMPFTILHRVIRSPLSLLSCRVSSLLINLHTLDLLVLVPFLWLLFGSFLIKNLKNCVWWPHHCCIFPVVLHLLYFSNLKLCSWLQFPFLDPSNNLAYNIFPLSPPMCFYFHKSPVGNPIKCFLDV